MDHRKVRQKVYSVYDSSSSSDYSSMELNQRQVSHPSNYKSWKSPDTEFDQLYEMILEKDSTKVEMKETLRTLPRSLTMKRKMIKWLNANYKLKSKQKRISTYRTISYYFARKWNEWRYDLRGMLFTWDLWYSALKSIQGHFGSGVATYFYFLRWLFICNLVFFIVIVCFLVIPQSVDPSSSTGLMLNIPHFSGKEFFTGAGSFTHTLMYYGYYSNGTIGGTVHYNISEAYLLTMGAFFLLWLISIAYCLAQAYKQEYIERFSSAKNLFSNKVFAGWEYTIETEEAAKLKSRSIYNELLEALSLHKTKIVKKGKIRMADLVKTFCIHTFVFGTMGAVGYLVYYILESEKLEIQVDFLKEMALSLTITAIMVLLPLFYVYISNYEVIKSKLVQLYIAVIRIVLLEVVVLGIIVYFRLFSRKKLKHDTECWETEFGQEIYRLLIVDFFFIVIFYTLFGEVFRYALHCLCPECISKTEFRIAWNTVNLIYTQTLTWLGVFYSPMIPLVTLVKLFIVFYMKRASVILSCKPSRKPWHASHIETVFLGLTFINFMLALTAVAFSAFRAESSKCGPFQHLETRYSSILNMLNKLEETRHLGFFIKYIWSPGFIAIALMLFCALVYYMRVKAQARNHVVVLLRRRIEMEGNDKTFLLKMIDKSNYNRSAAYSSEGARESNYRKSTSYLSRGEGKSDYRSPTASRSKNLHSKYGYNAQPDSQEIISDCQDIINELYEDKSLHRNSLCEIQLQPFVIDSSHNMYSGMSPASRHHPVTMEKKPQ